MSPTRSFSLKYGLKSNLIFSLIFGLKFNLIFGLKFGLKFSLIFGLKSNLIFTLIFGLKRRTYSSMKKIFLTILIILTGAALIIAVSGTADDIMRHIIGEPLDKGKTWEMIYDSSDLIDSVPEWEGLPFAYINENEPEFTDEEIWERAQESLSVLDDMGRVGTAMACIGQEIMPEEGRSQISSIKPTGWQSSRYDFIENGSLYNRCHLIGHQLTGDDAIDRNLMTGTRYMNIEGMLPFENAIAKYVKETGNHVMYRVTPAFYGRELVAKGVHLEALSVEDKGEGLSFNVYCYNLQPGVEIDYETGENHKAEDDSWLTAYLSGDLSARPRTFGKVDPDETAKLKAHQSEPELYILNTNTGKFHHPDCDSIRDMSEHNKHEQKTTREDLLIRGYEPCGNCKP